MWAPIYADRLRFWNLLRQDCRNLPIHQALLTINDWWLQAPATVRTMIWEQDETWPDPWALLAKPAVCDLARALGMLYTISMCDRQDCGALSVCQTDHDNLVLVDDGKYILNWAPGQLLNIQSQQLKVLRIKSSADFNHLIR